MFCDTVTIFQFRFLPKIIHNNNNGLNVIFVIFGNKKQIKHNIAEMVLSSRETLSFSFNRNV